MELVMRSFFWEPISVRTFFYKNVEAAINKKVKRSKERS